MSIFAVYKPFGMLSQFTREYSHHITLADLSFDFPKNVYPLGRLDADSEGLLILSNDKGLNAALLHPDRRKPKTYWVQVEGVTKMSDLEPLRSGLTLNIKKKVFKTAPAQAMIIPAPELPARTPPIRFRANVPTTWLEITLTEGKNRQVRKMCAKIGFPVLRLVRMTFGSWSLLTSPLDVLRPGDTLLLTS